jgi:diaminopimelate decarboxylase
MTNQDKPPTDDAEQIKLALERAASRARELAQRTGTPCYVIRDGRMVDAARENASQATPSPAR